MRRTGIDNPVGWDPEDVVDVDLERYIPRVLRPPALVALAATIAGITVGLGIALGTSSAAGAGVTVPLAVGVVLTLTSLILLVSAYEDRREMVAELRFAARMLDRDDDGPLAGVLEDVLRDSGASKEADEVAALHMRR
jgi:hypothetical protein